MEREDFRDPKRAHTLGQFHGASSEKWDHLEGMSRIIRYKIMTYRQGNYIGFSGSIQQFPSYRFCFTCGDPDHLMQKCTSQRGRGRPQSNSSIQARPPVPQGRG
ncbi:hypothetical protein R3W88_033506 [Solanum pinnatisectum]|uniref:CCHC-type domain-containing protein n=1 Tax=Solanum pinnatisectum TaxID=50273 RepID=A0AAV9K0Z8_9SOLN|nr:hypothetical protein R3W88_033506 [Solanum pinnatisectum]